MNPAQTDERIAARLNAVVSSLDVTLAADATLAREAYDASRLHDPLPIVSLDLSVGEALSEPRPVHAGPPPDLVLLGQLGAGGMGAVYAARQRALDREVAVKRPLSLEASESTRSALLAEARIMGSLEHPNIVPVHALGCDRGGLPVLVMKRIEGIAWRDLLRDPSHPMWDRVAGSHGRGLAFHVEVMVQVANALAFAHNRGVVHRDVKPENVMIGAFGEVYLLDWGIGHRIGAASDSQVVGTPAYMAPEMLLDPASADARTDVYLLGASLHEVLVGHPPHVGETLVQVFGSALSPLRTSFPASAPSDLVELCTSALSSDRNGRPASMEAFRDALVAHRAHRASHQLAATAENKLAAVEERIGAGSLALEGLEAGVLLAESRFGFEQSLREWAGNQDASTGLARSLALSIEREIALRNGSAARALVAALPTPRPDLATRVDVLERELAEARERETANSERARELDASVSALPRMLFYGAFLLVGGTLSTLAYLDEQRTGKSMSMAEQLWLDGIMTAFIVVGLFVGRRRLLANEYNRNTWALWLIGCVLVTAADVFQGSIGLDARTATVLDFLLFTGVFSVGALTVSRHLAWLAVFFASVSVATVFDRSLATPGATLVIILAAGVSAWHARKSAAS